jgi:hypothetical protein
MVAVGISRRTPGVRESTARGRANRGALAIGQSDTTASLWRQFVWLVLIEERPNMVLDERTKELRQMCFKERFKRRQLIMAHAWHLASE